MKPDQDRLRAVFNQLERRIEDRWGIPVHIQDVPNPFTGDLDGEQIMVDDDLDVEDVVFRLIHLFGRTVRWNVSRSFWQGGPPPPLVMPLAIPGFQPIQWLSRYQGTVV